MQKNTKFEQKNDEKWENEQEKDEQRERIKLLTQWKSEDDLQELEELKELVPWEWSGISKPGNKMKIYLISRVVKKVDVPPFKYDVAELKSSNR